VFAGTSGSDGAGDARAIETERATLTDLLRRLGYELPTTTDAGGLKWPKLTQEDDEDQESPSSSGIEHRIIQGGMHYVGFAELAAAVSEAGGLGIITGLTQRTPRRSPPRFRRCRENDRQAVRREPHLLPVVMQPDYPGYVRAIIEGWRSRSSRPPATTRRSGCRRLKEAGIKVIHKVHVGAPLR